MPRTNTATAGVLSRQRVHALALIAATLLGVYLCYRLIEPFLPALAWGLALAVVAYPIHKAICRRVPDAAVSAAPAAVTGGPVLGGAAALRMPPPARRGSAA